MHAIHPLQVHMVLQRVAFLMLFENKTMDEMFDTYVSDKPAVSRAFYYRGAVLDAASCSTTATPLQVHPQIRSRIYRSYTTPADAPPGPQRGRLLGPG